MSAEFTHLHLHTEYSLLDGAIRIPDLLDKCSEYGMESVAVTDHGVMYGALEFYTKAKKKGIKPIVGCEFYVAPESRLKKKPNDNGISAFHLVLLAMNQTGYRNLMKLASIASFEGFYYKPRIDKEVLAANNEGIIALSACLKGEIPWYISQNNMDLAREKALEYYTIFGDRLYFEIQENGIDKQVPINEGLMELGKEMNVKIVATNDCHYLNKNEAYAHEILLCIQTGKTITDPKHFRFSSDEFYFKPAQQMKDCFAYCPEAIDTSMEIMERCNLELDLNNYYFPKFPESENETLDSMFTKECWDGLEQRFATMKKIGTYSEKVDKQYRERLQMEIDVINTMGFPGYFLIVADFINWAKDNDIPVGPGRGSGAGSLAAYCMRITNIDPIPYGLIFERFLNIERKSMPDFDVDFCQDRRGKVIDYVRDKYGGAEYVAQILTYGTMKARGVIRDVGRVMDIPFGEVDKIAKLVPDQLKMTIKKALEEEPKLLEEANRDPRVNELIQISQTLEGLARHTSTHAAGVVISPTPLVDYLPTCKGSKDEPLTQYDMKHTEMTGLIKFDFLGLKTLTVIQKALNHIKSDKGIDLDIDTIPMDDPLTFELLCKGDAQGVFQLESPGMRELLVKMAPEQFTDLIALVALYRPGPLDSGMVDDFVRTKHGETEANYPLPQLKPVLEETYGVIVYQEQVMKIANILANYSLGDADILRRAMGKKIEEVMDAERLKFMKGARENNIPEDKAKYIFDLMAKFAGYGFNKSHSAAYALVTYQTAYLKAHYTAQFMAALLSCDMSNTDKVVLYISDECRNHGIDVLPPDINESMKDFTVKNDRIRFGLAAVKNVGESALDSIIDERETGGKFKSLSDFCCRVDSRKVNSRVIESLIKSGSFDSLGAKRSQLAAIIEKAMEMAKAVQRDKQSGQMSLFSVAPETQAAQTIDIPLPDIAEWSERQRLADEKETVGFYLSGHPLDNHLDDIRSIADTEIRQLAEMKDNLPVRVGGIIKSYRPHRSKKGDPMAFLEIEDVFESTEVIVFPDAFSRCGSYLENTGPIIVQGHIQKGERAAKIIAESIYPLEEAREKFTELIKIKLRAEKISREKLNKLKKILYQYHGNCPIVLTVAFPGKGEVDVDVMQDLTLRPCRGLSDKIFDLLGYPALSYRKRPVTIQRRSSWNNNRKNGYGKAAAA